MDLNLAADSAGMALSVPPRKGRVDLNRDMDELLSLLLSPAPQGAGGFKSKGGSGVADVWEVPPRKGRVDLNSPGSVHSAVSLRPAPQGAGGFKCRTPETARARGCPAPQGAGGFKSECDGQRDDVGRSRPARGGWI